MASVAIVAYSETLRVRYQARSRPKMNTTKPMTLLTIFDRAGIKITEPKPEYVEGRRLSEFPLLSEVRSFLPNFTKAGNKCKVIRKNTTSGFCYGILSESGEVVMSDEATGSVWYLDSDLVDGRPKLKPKMIPISDLRPGDIFRCNNRLFLRLSDTVYVNEYFGPATFYEGNTKVELVMSFKLSPGSS